MNTKTYLATFLIAASIVMATVSIPSVASADKSSGRDNGLDKKADDNVHDNAPGGLGGDIDKKFHEGLCQGGHSTDALDSIGGCDVLTDPGNSDDNRQDD